ncbi:MAG: FtsX-like permease family protein [Bacteroidota bacterium]
MNLPLFIAGRYLISKKKQNIINIISGISVAGVATGTFALVVVLSVFNGFNDLIRSYFSTLDPDLKITAAEGKMFDPEFLTDSVLVSISDIERFSPVIEENALLRYGNRQYIATIKGVPSNFSEVTGVHDLMVYGSFGLEKDNTYYAVVGQGIAGQLGITLDFMEPIHIYVPKRGTRVALNLTSSLNHDYIFPSGIFALLEEVDAKTVFVPIGFARNLFEAENRVSALEVQLKDQASVKKVRKLIMERAGEQYVVKNKYQQHDMLYKTMQSEKWATYLILIFILVIASFNILGSLSMLIIDKKEDIAILRSMGATNGLVRKIFLFEGWLISLTGVAAGLILGVLVSLAQIHFELLTLPGEGSFVITAYPVKIALSDLLMITLVVLTIGFVAAWYPVRYITQSNTYINPAGK